MIEGLMVEGRQLADNRFARQLFGGHEVKKLSFCILIRCFWLQTIGCYSTQNGLHHDHEYQIFSVFLTRRLIFMTIVKL